MKLPARLIGTGQLHVWLNQLRDYVAASTPLRSINSLQMETTTGTMKMGKAGGAAPPPAVGMRFRGEFQSGVSYSAGDVVVIRGGATAGTYVCMIANSGNSTATNVQDPAQGIYWIQIAPGYMIGNWG